MVDVKDNLFSINGESKIIFGGEMHYFRLPKENWRKIIKKIKEAGCNLISTYIPWCWHEYEEGFFDLTGTTRGERDLKGFLELLKEENMYCIVRPGPYIMAEVIFEGMPQWILNNYPEIIAKTKDGKEHRTKIVSYMHPTYLDKVQKWYKKVYEIIKEYQVNCNGSVIMVQLDNEVGMLQWVTNEGDYSENVLQHFKEFLIDKYLTIECLNANYNSNCANFDEFTDNFIAVECQSPLKFSYDYGHFIQEYYKRYIETLKEYSIENGIKLPFIVNVHGFETVSYTGRGNHYPIGLSQLYKAAQAEDVVLAGDYYIRSITYDNHSDLIINNAFTKAVQNQNQPLFSAEFQGGCLSDKPRLQPSDIDLSTRVCVGSGMNAINYYMFVSGENYENTGLFGRRHEWQAPLKRNGDERPHYKKIRYLGKLFNVFGDKIVHTNKNIDTYIGFYSDYYMTEYKNDMTAEVINELSVQRDYFQFDGILKSLTLANISYEAIDLIKEKSIDAGKVKSLWVFSSEWMDESVQKTLVQYVKDGGKLVLYPTVPKYNLCGEECTVLYDFIKPDIRRVEKDWMQINVKDMDSVFINYRLVLGDFTGQPLARYEKNGQKEVCAFSNNLGNGKVVLLGMGMEHDYDYKVELIKKIAEEVNVTSGVECSDLWTNILIRSNNEYGFIFINNFDEFAKNITIKLKNIDVFNCKKIFVPARSGLILPYECEITNNFKIKYSTIEIYDLIKYENTIELICNVPEEDAVGEIVIDSKEFYPIMQDGVNIERVNDFEFKLKLSGKSGNVKLRFCSK